MKTKVVCLVLAVVGIVLAGWGVSTLLFFRSFTETTEGRVDRWSGNEVIIQFQTEISTPPPQEVRFKSEAEYAFPRNQQTATLKVGDKVTAYHPPGKLYEARLDKDFPYHLPYGALAAGTLMIVTGAAVILAGRK